MVGGNVRNCLLSTSLCRGFSFDMITELNNFLKLTKRRKQRLKRKSRKQLRREKQQTWKNGRLITFVSIDIFGGIHRFLCQMRKCNKDFHGHRCLYCRLANSYRPCMDIGGEMYKECMRKSDTSCYPHKLRVIK